MVRFSAKTETSVSDDEQRQDEQGADDREDADAQRQQRGHHPAEHDDERDEGHRRGQELGPPEVVLGLLAHLAGDLGPPGHDGAHHRGHLVNAPVSRSATLSFSSRLPFTDPNTSACRPSLLFRGPRLPIQYEDAEAMPGALVEATS